MDVSDNVPDQSAESLKKDSIFLWKSVGPALLLLAGAATVMCVAKLLPLFFADSADRILRVTLVVAAVCMAVAVTLRHRRQWILPAMEMRRLVHEIRMSRAPIEEFAESDFGALRDLSAELTLLLQDLRHQRQSITELKDDVKQRLAHRTDVMERTVASLRNQAVRDPLTGLYNRRMLDQLLPQLITQCQADHRSLTLIMIDMDYFKRLNDTLGHAAGDEMLKSVGQIVHSTIRDGDCGFRYGGDEFVVLLPGADPTASAKIAERLQSLVVSMGKTYKLPQCPKLSFGISALAELTEPTAANLLKRADERLYEAKAARTGTAGPAGKAGPAAPQAA